MEIVIRGKGQIGPALRRIRKLAGKTQLTLSQESRIEQAMISKIETGGRIPELATLLHLCSVLGLDLVLRRRGGR